AACFARLRSASPAADLFTVLRQREAVTVPRDDLARDVVRLRDALLALEREGAVVASDVVRRASGGYIVQSALAAFRSYPTTPALRPGPEGIVLCAPTLLFSYQTRLAAHGLAWDTLAPPGSPPARAPVSLRASSAGGVSGVPGTQPRSGGA